MTPALKNTIDLLNKFKGCLACNNNNMYYYLTLLMKEVATKKAQQQASKWRQTMSVPIGDSVTVEVVRVTWTGSHCEEF
jgi:hypothetical protein